MEGPYMVFRNLNSEAQTQNSRSGTQEHRSQEHQSKEHRGQEHQNGYGLKSRFENILVHVFFFIRINIFQPSLRVILNSSRFQP